MRHYCTLFDSKYLPQGLVLYESLLKHSSEPFTLYVLAMDDQTLDALMQLEFPNCKVRAISQVDGLKDIRRTRTWQEFCWTAASCFTEWILWQYPLPEITYLDADMMFFSDPKVIFDEIGDRSIGVIPHRFIPEKQHLEVNGKFNVGWVTFKNNAIGRECVSTWAAQCREKCSHKDCGDQKYLDAWPEKYGDELCVIQNIGADLAPWNLANYELHSEAPELFLKSYVRDQNGFRLWERVVFYHFHEYIHSKRLTNYQLRPEDSELIYKPYIAAVTAAEERVKSLRIPA